MVIKTTLFKKRGQMKIQQMSFMLLGVFLFFALVGMIMLTIKFSDLKQSATDLKEQNAFLLVSKLASSPEFSCGDVFGGEKTDCIDQDKVMMLKENINSYKGFWGVSNIQIRKIYPSLGKDVECIRTNYQRCNLITLIDKPLEGYSKSNFVALCKKELYKNKVVNKCEMARVTVWYEEVK